MRSAAVLLGLLSVGCGSRGEGNLPPILPSRDHDLKVEVDVEEYSSLVVPEAQESGVAVAAIALPLAKSAAKALNKAVWSAMDKYADKYGASYSAGSISSNFQSGSQERLVYPFVFRRIISFESKAQADAVLAEGYRSLSGPDARPYRVAVVEVPFVLMTSGSQARSWRFVGLDDPAVKKVMWDKKFPKEVSYHARAAKVLGVGKVDQFEVAISVICRVSQSSGSGLIQITSDPASISLKGDRLKKPRQPLAIASDWFPAPVDSNAYSVKCSVVETSRMKDLIKKAAAAAKDQGDSLIDKQFEEE